MQLWKQLYCLLTYMLLSTVLGNDKFSTESNEVIPKEPKIKGIDDRVRQALLRAIDKLEKQTAEEYSAEQDIDNKESDIEALLSDLSTTANPVEEILEESTTSDVAPTVQFFTATFDDSLSKEQPLITFFSKENKPKQKIKTIVSLGSPDTLNTTDLTVVDNRQATRSISSDNSNEISAENKSEIQFEITKLKKKPVPTVHTTTKTTTIPTTTTTPRPTHNEDGENIELVDKKDIKIQAAPLVTAFTVDLDERGAAKNVIPIVDRPSTTVKTEEIQASSVGPTIARLNVLQSGFLLPTPLPTATYPQSNVNQVPLLSPVPSVVNTQLPPINTLQQQQQIQNYPLVNNYLIERQQALEQQIFQLQLQAKRQQEEIAKQLQILEQQAKQRHQQQSLPPQPILSPFEVPTTPRPPGQNSGFTIRPSIEFIPATKSPHNFAFSPNQQLPIKEVTKFHNDGNNNLFNPNEIFSKGNINNNQYSANTNGNPIFGENGNPNIFGNIQRLQHSPPPAQSSSIQIQPSNQFSFIPNLPTVAPPPELSPFQNLPQNNHQIFQNLPFLSGNDNLLQQQQQQYQQLQQQQRSRQFRQEIGTGNLGLNHLTTSQNQDFYRQQLTTSNSNNLHNVAASYQSGIGLNYSPEFNIISKVLALNHGINPYAQQNLRYTPGNSAGF